jgi:hypothetical protein
MKIGKKGFVMASLSVLACLFFAGCNSHKGSALEKVYLLAIVGSGTRYSGDVVLWNNEKIYSLDIELSNVKPTRRIAVSMTGQYAAWISFDPRYPNKTTVSIWELGEKPTLLSKSEGEGDNFFESLIWVDEKLLISTIEENVFSWVPGENKLKNVTDEMTKRKAISTGLDTFSPSTSTILEYLPEWVEIAIAKVPNYISRLSNEKLSKERFSWLRLELISQLPFVALATDTSTLSQNIILDVADQKGDKKVIIGEATSFTLFDVSNKEGLTEVQIIPLPKDYIVARVRISINSNNIFAALIDEYPSSETRFEDPKTLGMGMQPTQIPSLWVYNLSTQTWKKIANELGPIWVLNN